MIFEIVVAILPLIMPYTYLGENLGALTLSFVALLFLIKSSRKISISKIYFTLLCMISLVAIITQIFISPYLESFSGIFNYINMALYYLVLSIITSNDNKKETLFKYMVLSLSVMAIIYIIVQGLYFDVRIYGNIGYANSYALLLLVGIYINKIRKKDKTTEFVEIVLALGIFFTGSRTTLILLLAYIILNVILQVKNKKQKDLSFIWTISIAFLQYIIYSSLGLASIFIAPIIIYLYYIIRKLKLISRINIGVFSGLIAGLMIIGLFFNNSNTIQRLRNISLSNGSFQERIVYYEDTLKAVIKNPMGNGINMFQYKSYDNASAFYDVKYVHNSILQTSYDIGILGGILFIIIMVYGLFLLFNTKQPTKHLFAGMYITIFIHSLLDFDFSYSTFGIIITLIIGISYENKREVDFNKMIKIIYSAIFVVVVYLGLFEGTLSIAKNLAINNNIEYSNTIYNVGKNICMERDARPLFYKAAGFKSLYDKSGNEEFLQSSLDCLKEANLINKYDPRILWNMAYIYEKKGDIENTIKLKDEILVKERFYKEAYSSYNTYLDKLYEESKNEKYNEIIEKIDEYYKESKEKLNNKAIYLKNQL